MDKYILAIVILKWFDLKKKFYAFPFYIGEFTERFLDRSNGWR